MGALYLSQGVRRCQAAYLEADRLKHYDFARANEPTLHGAVFLGRVRQINRAGAFIDLGQGNSGFLKLQGKADFTEGAALSVEVTRDGFQGKSPTLSREITVPSPHIIGILEGAKLHFSRRLKTDNTDARNTLAAACIPLTENGHGAILRHTASQLSPEALETTVMEMTDLLEDLRARLENASSAQKAPVQIRPAQTFLDRLLADWSLPADTRVHADDPTLLHWADAQGFETHTADGPMPLFQKHQLDEQVASLSQARVPLSPSGSLIIETTRALTTIDVNAGDHLERDWEKRAALVNTVAAQEIAWQMRLRQSGGHFVVDFLRQRDRAAQRQTLQALTNALRQAGLRARVAGPSELGLYEFTLPRYHRPLAERLLSPCAICGGYHHDPALEILVDTCLDRLKAEAHHLGRARLVLRTHPDLWAALKPHLQTLALEVIPNLDDSLDLSGFDILPQERDRTHS